VLLIGQVVIVENGDEARENTLENETGH